MSDNPFSEPGEQDRTVIRPMPGGSRATAHVPPAPRPAAAPAAQAVAGPDIDAIPAGDGPLAIAAAPLLILLARLRNTATAPDPGDMRERTRRELRAFERRAKDAGVPMDQMRLAHYAMCAALPATQTGRPPRDGRGARIPAVPGANGMAPGAAAPPSISPNTWWRTRSSCAGPSGAVR